MAGGGISKLAVHAHGERSPARAPDGAGGDPASAGEIDRVLFYCEVSRKPLSVPQRHLELNLNMHVKGVAHGQFQAATFDLLPLS